MNNQEFILNWTTEVCEKEKETFKEVLSLPVIEMTNDEYLHTIGADWFSEEFYEVIKKHNFTVVIKNNETGERTAIRTFGARFPMVLSQVA